MYRFVFDVESVGLYGPAFAFGYVVVDENGEEYDNGIYWLDPAGLPGRYTDHLWVTQHVEPMDLRSEVLRQEDLRNMFWATWMSWRKDGAEMWADCAFPVEAGFLLECVRADRDKRGDTGPYPLHEIATVVKLAGLDPTGAFLRLDSELPAHNPLNDARQSARILTEMLRAIEAKA